MAAPAHLPVVDPHFHVWDVTDATLAPGHNLFAPLGAKDGVYDTECYERDIDGANSARTPDGMPLKVVGGVHVEARSVGYPEIAGDALNKLCVEETRWVVAQLSKSKRPYNVVASISLEADNADATLAETVACRNDQVKVVGVRQILNHKPSWPRNDNLGELLDNPKWVRNFSLLGKYNLSFDAQLNPRQYAKAYDVFAAHPTVQVNINHIGTPTPEFLDTAHQEEYALYRDGMAKFASLASCYLKISMLYYCTAGRIPGSEAACPYFTDMPHIAAAVDHLIALFTPRRCMFASNFPVDGNEGQSCEGLYTAFAAAAANYTAEERARLFAGTACEAYRLSV